MLSWPHTCLFLSFNLYYCLQDLKQIFKIYVVTCIFMHLFTVSLTEQNCDSSATREWQTPTSQWWLTLEIPLSQIQLSLTGILLLLIHIVLHDTNIGKEHCSIFVDYFPFYILFAHRISYDLYKLEFRESDVSPGECLVDIKNVN